MANPYLPSGTVFPFQTPTAYNPGERDYGDDFVQLNVTSVSGTYLVGPSGAQVLPVTTSRIVNFLPSTVTMPVYSIAAQDSEGGQNSSTPNTFEVFDAVGAVSGSNIKISGATSAVTVNGSTGVTIFSTNYGKKTFTNISGNSWISY